MKTINTQTAGLVTAEDLEGFSRAKLTALYDELTKGKEYKGTKKDLKKCVQVLVQRKIDNPRKSKYQRLEHGRYNIRPRRTIFPVGKGMRAEMAGILMEGATIEELMERFDISLTQVRTGITRLTSVVGYGVREDENGVIYLLTH